MHISRYLIPALSALGISLAGVSAANARVSGPYFGGSYGQYDIEANNLDETDTLWKAFAGARFNEWLGAEASFVNFDRARNQGSSYEADGWSGAAIVSVPFAANSAVYAKGGVFWWDAQSNFGNVRRDEDGNDPFWGAGLRFGLADPFGVRIEYERYEVVDTDIDTVSVGLQANF